MMHSYPTCDLRANCSQSSWDWSVLLQGCPADSEAIQSCNVSHLPPFALESLSSRSLELPHCSSTTFQWQSLFTTASQQVDISNCPLVCSCETAWVVNSHLEHLHVRLPRQFQCSPICPPAELDRQEKGAPVVGQFFQLEYRIIGQILPSSTINKTRQYFKWQGSRTGHSHREQIFDKLLRLEIFNVSEADVGVINIVCWHCVQPLFAYFEVRVPTPLSLQVETSDASSFRLAVQGYPVDKISLTVVDAKGENMTSDLSSTASTKFWKTMVVRPDSAHSLFHRRIFNIFTTSCTDCPEDHLAGDYTFTFCTQEKELTLNDTGECKSINHHFNKFNASDLVHIQPNYEHRISLEPVVIVVLIFLTLFMAAAFINAKLHNIKSVGWRKWRWSFHSRLSRRTSHATEETMLRLEERLSLSSDYTGHVIPCIKGGAVQIHEQIGKGAFGAVYCGTWEQTGPRSVAVKALVEADAEVEKEATVLCRLDHDNIVRLYGLTRDGDRLLLVFEMMRLGDLRSYLKARAPQPGSYASFPAALDQSELKFIVRQVARGLCYLVAQQIVHRDLAARNCLVDGESDQMCGNPKQRPSISVKISDFGMSRRLSYNSDYYRMQNQSLLPVRWLPPEAISDHRFSSKSDIWSLGVTMWEIFSYGGVPFDTLSNHEVVSYALAGMRPPKPVSCPNDVYSLMERCWALDPEQRLTAEDVFLDPAVAESLEVGLL